MTSPVDTSVKWARSSMPGAPVLPRTAGALIALLDALLVNGWGLQTASSVVVAGGVATATFPTDHAAAKHAVVLVDGVTGALTALNGEQKVTAVAPNVIKWATAAADGTATGTITVKMAPAGFNKPFSGTNLAAYKSAHPAAHGQYLRINDTTANYARAVGYENMTAISTGTGLFPSAAQLNGGYYWGKDEEPAGTGNAPYLFASDGRTFYLCVQLSFNYYSGNPRAHQALVFGDLVPESPGGDPFATVIAGGVDTNWALEGGGAYVWDYMFPDNMVAVPRGVSGAGTAVRGATNCDLNLGVLPDLPNPITGAIPMGRVLYHDTVTSFPRASFPGVQFGPCPRAEKLIDAHAILDMPDGRSFVSTFCSTGVNENSGLKAVFIDITGPWR